MGSELGDADRQRLRHAYEASHRQLWQSVFAFAGVREVADEATAEAFAQAARRGAAVRDVEAWVWRAAFAIARAELARRAAAGLTDTAIEHGHEPDDVPDYALDAIAVLRDLDLRDREVLVLRYVADLTHTEIADRCGVSPAAVRVRLHRARTRARRLLEGHRD